MKNYILSIVGVVLIGALIDIVLPDGKLNKFLKSIFSIFVISVMISPISSLIKNSQLYLTNASSQYSSTDIVYDSMIESKQKYIESLLNANGYSNVDIILQYSIKNDDLVIEKCKVFTNKMVIDSDKPHMNNYEYIRRLVKNCVMLDDEEIEFYE